MLVETDTSSKIRVLSIAKLVSENYLEVTKLY